MTVPTRVAVVDDHRFMAQTLAIALQDNGYDAVLIDPSRDVVEQVERWRPAVVLLDLQLTDTVRGDDLIPLLAAGKRAVVVLTAELDAARWGACVSAGARGVLAKSVDLEEIVAAVGAAAKGSPVVSEHDRISWLRAHDRRRAEADRQEAPFRQLTPREREVLSSLLDGEPAAAIATKSVVSEATVRTQIRSVLNKLGVASQLQAVALARRAGWQPHSAE